MQEDEGEDERKEVTQEEHPEAADEEIGQDLQQAGGKASIVRS